MWSRLPLAQSGWLELSRLTVHSVFPMWISLCVPCPDLNAARSCFSEAVVLRIIKYDMRSDKCEPVAITK